MSFKRSNRSLVKGNDLHADAKKIKTVVIDDDTDDFDDGKRRASAAIAAEQDIYVVEDEKETRKSPRKSPQKTAKAIGDRQEVAGVKTQSVDEKKDEKKKFK